MPKLIGRWISWLATTHASSTLTIWEIYAGTHWIPFFGGVEATYRDITPERCDEYMRARLLKVRSVTVKKEHTALRSFLGWLEGEGYAVPTQNGLTASANVPRLPKRAAGVKHTQRRRVAASALSPEHVRLLIKALPEWSITKKLDRFPVRARFIIAYETSLRPSSLDRIETPKHYRAGESMLRLTDDTDKARWGRDVPLSKRARRVLSYVVRGLGEGYEGPIFGTHDYRGHIQKAAKDALPREIAERFCGAHLRSARITHLLEKPQANLPGVQQLAGHKLMSTTARYVKPSFRAAQDALGDEL